MNEGSISKGDDASDDDCGPKRIKLCGPDVGINILAAEEMPVSEENTKGEVEIAKIFKTDEDRHLGQHVFAEKKKGVANANLVKQTGKSVSCMGCAPSDKDIAEDENAGGLDVDENNNKCGKKTTENADKLSKVVNEESKSNAAVANTFSQQDPVFPLSGLSAKSSKNIFAISKPTKVVPKESEFLKQSAVIKSENPQWEIKNLLFKASAALVKYIDGWEKIGRGWIYITQDKDKRCFFVREGLMLTAFDTYLLYDLKPFKKKLSVSLVVREKEGRRLYNVIFETEERAEEFHKRIEEASNTQTAECNLKASAENKG